MRGTAEVVGALAMIATTFFSQLTVQFAILGMATGSLYAMMALGIVVTYRASGVLNFAAGALGALAAFFYFDLRDHGVAWPLALVFTLLLGAAIGAVTQVLVMRVLRNVSMIGKLIATLGLISLSQGLVNVIYDPQTALSPTSFLPTTSLSLTSQITVPEDRLILLGIVLTATAILAAVYARTMFGLATSAVAENRRVAALSGWSTTTIEVVNFMVAGALAAATAVLLAPIVGLDVSVLTLVVFPSLAAALVGRFSSFGITLVAALGIGVITAELQLFQPDIARIFGTDAQTLQGLPDVVPVLIIILYTAFVGRARLERGATLTRLPLPGSGRVPKFLLAAGVAVTALLILSVSPSWDDAFTMTMAIAILVLSVVVLTGFAGQLSLAQFALAGFGAWVAARLIATQGFPFLLGGACGILACIALGLVIALPALRTRGVNLAVATLGLSSLIYSVVFNNGPLTGGFLGTKVGSPHIAGMNIDPILHSDRYGIFVLALLVIVGLIVANVRRGRTGRRLIAVRANERAAASIGVGVYGAKLYAFALSAAIAGVAGVSIAFMNPNVQFTSFDVFGSINAVVYAVIGGLGWASGSIIGAQNAPAALPAKVIDSLFGSTEIGNYLLIFSGAVTFLILRSAPDGVAAMQSRQWRALTGRVSRRSQGPSLPPVSKHATARRDRPPATLSVSAITVRFGGVVALHDVSFEVTPGQIVGLIGPNGAGKTTLLDVVTGFTKPQEGSVLLDGDPVDALGPEGRARRGMARSWQAVELFEELTVRENLLVAADAQNLSTYLTDIVRPGRMTHSQAVNEVIAEFELERHLDQRPSELSQGTGRLVGIGRAIATEPRVLLLDEPAAGLDSRESRELGDAIRAVVARTGIGALVVEHDVNLLLDICDRIVVLDFGRKIAEGTPDAIANDPSVIAAYLGTADDELGATKTSEIVEPA